LAVLPQAIQVGPHQVGPRQPLLLIAGPCVIESVATTREIALRLCDLLQTRDVQFVFKASFDKANRTSLSSYRGPGLEEGLRVLDALRQELGVPVTTDVHLPQQAGSVAEVCDLLQVPAFLCRQTDLLLAVGDCGRAVHLKKGQFMAPGEMRYAAEKLRSVGCRDILLCERGTFFGYGRLVNDMGSLPVMRSLGYPVVFDATHSVQQPGGPKGVTGGQRGLVAPLARAAAAVGIDGLFLETHPHPEAALSDGPNMVPLGEVATLVDQVLRVRAAVESDP
jgi:2-dehydro-3-deoxyphosphooctonate aldolase (KDO 8-P synthase)